MKFVASPLPHERFALGFLTVLQHDPESDEEVMEVPYEVGESLFPGDARMAESFAHRFRAMVEVLDRTEFTRWLGQRPDGKIYLHPAFLAAGATVRLNKNGKLPIRGMTRSAEEFERVEYSDWEWPDGAR